MSEQSDFKREPRYFVVKLKDAQAYLTSLERDILGNIASKVARGRRQDGKPPLECVVVEADWPEHDPVWRAIEARMTGQPGALVFATPLPVRDSSTPVADWPVLRSRS